MTHNLMTNDSLRSLTSGLGDPKYDKAAGAFHVNRLMDDVSLLTSYRNSWIAGKIVDIPAMDSLRKGRDWQADKKDITLIEKEEKRLGLWSKLLECKTKARLWGGAAVVIGASDGSDYSQPFDFEKVGKGGLPYLTVMTRKELTANQLSTDPMSEWYSKPESYLVTGLNKAFVQLHPSRLIVQLGSPHPDPWNAVGSSFGWSDSVLQRVYDSIINTDSTAANLASLVFEANVDTFGIPDLMEQVSNSEYEKRLLDRLTLANVGKSTTKSLIHDTEEEYARHTINFSGLPDVMQSFLLMVSGASDIPLTRFLGQAPSGLSSTGEGDMKNYYDRIESMQTLEIEPAMWRFDEALIRSALGDRPDEIFYNWTPLEQLNEKDQAEIGLKKAQAAEVITRTGLFDQEELRKVVANQFIEDGFYPGLGDTMVDDTPEFNLGEEPTSSSEEIQALALNGAQVTSMQQLVQAVAEGTMPLETAKAVISAAFPALTETEISAITNPLKNFKIKSNLVTDATPRTLYMRRDVLNAEEIAEWYREQGVTKVYAPESMHTTIVYSKKPIDWMKFGEPWDATLELKEGGPRLHEKFGDDGSVLVLLFASSEVNWRHERARDFGASYDFEEYQSHISITLEGRDVDLKTLKPWVGRIILGPEIYEEIDDVDWRKKVVTDDLFS